MSLQSILENVLSGTEGTYGIAVKHLETGESASVHGDDTFQTASACKVSILAALFNEADNGRLNLAKRIRLSKEDLVPGSGVFQLFDPGAEVSLKDLATLMIIVSDNLATDKVLEFVGKENVNALTKGIGLKKTHLEHNIWELLSLYVGRTPKEKNEDTYKELDEWLEQDADYSASSIFDMNVKNNISTPNEMNVLLESIYRYKIASPKACDEMLKILSHQQFGHRLPYLLPEGARSANKTGTIGGAVNDVGIIYLSDNKGAFAISVLTRDIESKVEAESRIAQLAKAAYEYFSKE
ncbi:MAG: serine hydrolase [Tuberibacillus sp.]